MSNQELKTLTCTHEWKIVETAPSQQQDCLEAKAGARQLKYVYLLLCAQCLQWTSTTGQVGVDDLPSYTQATENAKARTPH